MRVNIFYKCFIIIFLSFLIVLAVNINIDYHTTLNSHVELLKQQIESQVSLTFASDMKKQELTKDEFLNEFQERYTLDTPSMHVLLYDGPVKEVKLENGSVSETQGNDEIIAYKHGYMSMPSATVLKNVVTQLETKQSNLILGNNKYLLDEYTDSNMSLVLEKDYSLLLMDDPTKKIYMRNQSTFKDRFSDYPNTSVVLEYVDSDIIYKLLADGQSVSYSHDDFVDIGLELALSTVFGTSTNLAYYEHNYKEGLIIYTKKYIASCKDGVVTSLLENSVSDMDDYVEYEKQRILHNVEDYYVVSIYYVDGIGLYTNVRGEIIENKKEVYLITIIVSLLASLLLSFMLTRRIKKISLATYKIANQNFNVQLTSSAKDELGDLTQNINMMSEKLKNTIDSLNTEIEHVKKLENVRKEFIANFTHEIKTPLAIINGYIELLDEIEVDEATKKHYLSIIQKESQHINRLVMAMLDLSRLESHRVTLQLKQVNVEELTRCIVEDFVALLKQKNLQIHFEMEDIKIEVDQREIEKVIRNFLSNAIYHTPEYGKIIISYQNGRYIIENEGKQIENEAMEHIFDTYVSSNRSGTGLGLAICKAVLELHGFNYGVYNTNTGVAFYFEPQE